MSGNAEQSTRQLPCQYDLFRKKPVSDQVEHGFVEYFYSQTAPRTGQLEFEVQGNADHMIIPCGTFLKLTVQLEGTARRTANDGSVNNVDIGGGAKVGIVNNILHSIFESVDVYLSNQATTKTDKHNPYISYFQTLCNYGDDQQDTYCRLSGWAKDTAGSMEDYSAGGNKGVANRNGFLINPVNSPKMELIGRLNSPVFHQEKALPTMVNMKVVLKKAADKFCLMHEEGNFSLKIIEAILMVQKVQTVAGMQKAFIDTMEQGNAIPYFLRTPRVNYMTIEQGASQFMRDNLFLGKLPRRIIIGMVETAAYQGDPQKNPFNFQHFGLQEICLYKDGVPYPRPMIKLDIENGICADAYHHFMTSLKAAYSRFVPGRLTMEDYKSGYTLFSYDMSPDQLGSVHPGSLHDANANIRLEMRFKSPITHNVTLLVYCEEDYLMEIRKDRRVSVNN